MTKSVSGIGQRIIAAEGGGGVNRLEHAEIRAALGSNSGLSKKVMAWLNTKNKDHLEAVANLEVAYDRAEFPKPLILDPRGKYTPVQQEFIQALQGLDFENPVDLSLAHERTPVSQADMKSMLSMAAGMGAGKDLEFIREFVFTDNVHLFLSVDSFLEVCEHAGTKLMPSSELKGWLDKLELNPGGDLRKLALVMHDNASQIAALLPQAIQAGPLGAPTHGPGYDVSAEGADGQWKLRIAPMGSKDAKFVPLPKGVDTLHWERKRPDAYITSLETKQTLLQDLKYDPAAVRYLGVLKDGDEPKGFLLLSGAEPLGYVLITGEGKITFGDW